LAIQFYFWWRAALSSVVVLILPPPKPVPKQESLVKKTQEVGEFKPEDGEKIADLQVKPSANPYASAGAYGFAVSEVSKIAVNQALQFFKAEHGRMPKDYDEFMSQIIKRNNIKLPVLPGNRRYQYDPAKYELVIVEAEKADK
jgi:hypothetical protein